MLDVCLTRLNGEPIWFNSELISCVQILRDEHVGMLVSDGDLEKPTDGYNGPAALVCTQSLQVPMCVRGLAQAIVDQINEAMSGR